MADFTMYDREREFKWQIECQLTGGTNAYIDAEDIYSGRLTRQISSGEGIEVGSCYVSELDLTIVASALPTNVVSVKPYFRLLTSTEIVEGVVRKYYTPYNLGVFKIASTKRKEYGRIDLVCYDKMADLDTLITPAAYTELLASDWKPFYLLDWIATKVNVTYTFTQSGIEAMPNGTLYFKLAEETSNIKTYRDLLQYVCMLIGAYGIFDEDGHLNVKTFADVTSYSLPASFRFSESFGDVPIVYSGVELTVKNATSMFGNANNTVVRLSDNPFLYTLSTLNQTTDYATFIMLFLRNIYAEFQNLSYYAGEFEIPPDASLNVGRLLAVSGGGASNTINCFLQKIDVNFDGRMMLSCGNPNTYVARTQNRTTSSITNLTNRIETLESSQGGNKIYTSKTVPDNTLGNDGDLWIKYFVDYNDKLVNSHGDEVDINLPRYESADDAYNYVDLTIRPQLRSMCNLASTEMNAFIKAFEGGLSIVAYLGSNPTHNITASQFSQLTADTYTINNQSFSISNGGNFLSWGDNPVYYRYIGTSESDLLPFGAIVNMDDFNENLFDGYEITVLYYYVYYNTSNKKFEYIYGGIKFENVNHTYWSDKLNKRTSNISIDLLDTAFYSIDELYCKINGDWVSYNGDGGSTVIVNQILSSGTEIAQISVDGEVVSIYAPTSQKEVYYGTSLPTTDIGQDSSLYYKTIQRPEDLKTLNVVEYIQSASGTYIPTDILLTSTTRIMMQGTFYRGYYEGRIAFGTEGRDLSDDVGRFVAITSSTTDISNCRFYFGSGNGSCEGIYETDVMLIADTATRTLTISGNGTSHSATIPSGVLYTPSSTPIGILCTNTSSEAGGFSTYMDYRKMNANAIIKRFQVYENNVLSYDLIPVQNANDVTDCGLYDRIHKKYYPGINTGSDTPFTAGTPTGEVINQLDECVEAGYLRVNDEWWEIYNGGTEYFAGNYIEITKNNVITSTLKAGTNIQIADDGTISASGADVTQIVTSGTEIATINGTSIYAPTVSASQTQTSGTEIGNITVGSTSTTLYAPTPQSVSVTQTLTSGTEIGSVTIDNTTTTLYAPSGGGGGSNVTVTPITTTGTNIANIAVNGTTYNLFAPSGGGGGSGHNYSTTEQVIGTWIDGSTIYEKTYSVQNNSATSGETEIALSDINDVTKVEGFTTDTNYNRVVPLAYRSNTDSYITETISAFFNKSTSKLVVRWKGINFGTAYITIQYTKTS